MDPTSLTVGLGSAIVGAFGGGVAVFRFLSATFVERDRCVERHAKADRDSQDRSSAIDGLRMEIRQIAQAHDVELGKVKVHLARSDERQRWLVAAVDSIMRTIGANGVPPPPA